MEDIVHEIAGYVSLGLDGIAILMVAAGALYALVEILLAIARRQATGTQTGTRLRAIFVDFARWLVAALTFQLGADIVSTTIAPGWDELGRLAAVAGIRTFLTYFLDRDLDKVLEEQHLRRQEQANVDSSREGR